MTLPDSACVYCGNCVAVCPTGALMSKSEYDLRQAGAWDEENEEVDDRVLLLRRRLQPRAARAGRRVVKVTSPDDHDVTRGNLCVKGRFGTRYVRNRAGDDPRPGPLVAATSRRS